MRGFFLGIFPEVPWSYWTWSRALDTSLLTTGWTAIPQPHSLCSSTSLWVEWKLLVHEAKVQSSWWVEQRVVGKWVEAQSSCGTKTCMCVWWPYAIVIGIAYTFVGGFWFLYFLSFFFYDQLHIMRKFLLSTMKSCKIRSLSLLKCCRSFLLVTEKQPPTFKYLFNQLKTRS